MAKPRFQAPRGTRDLYPLEMARRQWLLERWRRVSTCHGFEEIDGPTFETSDLYAVKSGDGILGELFQAFSGKDPAEVQSVQETGRAPFAMRPEFTPTLARMYASRAAQLPRPTRWFMVGPFFRAEKPQRGRLREFLQWNADVLGDDSDRADQDIFELLIGFLERCGLTPDVCRIEINDRNSIEQLLMQSGITEDLVGQAFTVLDKRAKLPDDVFASDCREIGLDLEAFDAATEQALGQIGERFPSEWIRPSADIVRGLAYYTGTVFEVIADGERAIAGGGRYDRLVELFGGPSTPAVGFGMGDVVLTNLLQDKGLMPSDRALLDELGTRPDVFVITAQEVLDPELAQLLVDLRRQGVHARRTSKTTRNIGKLLKEADAQHARFCAILESPGVCTLKSLDGEEEFKQVSTAELHERCRP